MRDNEFSRQTKTQFAPILRKLDASWKLVEHPVRGYLLVHELTGIHFGIYSHLNSSVVVVYVTVDDSGMTYEQIVRGKETLAPGRSDFGSVVVDTSDSPAKTAQQIKKLLEPAKRAYEAAWNIVPA